MRNPLRDEGAAFQLVLTTVAAFGLIALGSWIDAWLGLAVFLGLLVAGGVALRRAYRARHGNRGG